MQEDLPMVQAKSEFLSLLSRHQVVIVVGETGCGKTTQIPQILDEAGYCRNGKIVITQPRRIAAIRIAERVAEEMEKQLGRYVGYKVRFEEERDSSTRILFVTDGILWYEMRDDPLLSQYSVVVIDEVHERNKFSDFSLAALKTILRHRSDLKLIISSATADTSVFTRFFKDAAVLNVPGRAFPVTTEYRPYKDMIFGAAKEVERIHHTMPEGDILVFLPGVSDVMRAVGRISGNVRGVRALPLFGGIDPRLADEAFGPSDCRKIICATNVAETSITIPGIRYVVDSGFEKQGSWDYDLEMQLLKMMPISKASAKQRAGRAGRTQEGHCIRLYREDQYEAKREYGDPSILIEDITDLTLYAATLPGAPKLEELDLPTKVSSRTAMRARMRLVRWGALNEDGSPTDRGKILAQIPIEPMYGNLLLNGLAERNCGHEALYLATFLQSRDIFLRTTSDESSTFEEFPLQEANQYSDLFTFLAVWEDYKSCAGDPDVWCLRHGINSRVMQSIVKISWQLRHRLERLGFSFSRKADAWNYEGIQRMLLRTFPEYLCGYAGDNCWRTSKVNGIKVVSYSAIAKRKPEWFLATDFLKTNRIWARDNTEVPAAMVRELLPERFGIIQATMPAAEVEENAAPLPTARRLCGNLIVERYGRTRKVRFDLGLTTCQGVWKLAAIPQNALAFAPTQIPITWLRFSDATYAELRTHNFRTLADLPRYGSAVVQMPVCDAAKEEVLDRLLGLDLIVKPQTEEDQNDEMIAQQLLQMDATSLLSLTVKEAGLSRPLVMKLAGMGILRVRDLVKTTRRKLEKRKGASGTGFRSILDDGEEKELETLLARFGYTLPDKDVETMDIVEKIAACEPVSEEKAEAILGREDWELFRQYRATGSLEIRNKIALRHRRSAFHFARYSIPAAMNRRDPAIEIDDLAQEGMIGLMTGVTMFDPLSGNRFLTYAGAWIKQAISRFCGNSGNIRLPMYRVEFIDRMFNKIKLLWKKYGDELTLADLAQGMECPVEEVVAAIDDSRLQRSLSLDYDYSNQPNGKGRGFGKEDNGQATLHETVSDPNADLSRKIHKAELSFELEEVLRKTPLLEAERSIIIKVYGLFGEDEHEIDDVAKELGIPAAQVAIRTARVFKVLRKREIWEKFKDDVRLEDYETGQIRFRWQKVIEALEKYLACDRTDWSVEQAIAEFVSLSGYEAANLKEDSPINVSLRTVAALILSYDLDVSDFGIAVNLGCDEEDVPKLIRKARQKLVDKKRSSLLAGWADTAICENIKPLKEELEDEEEVGKDLLFDTEAQEKVKVILGRFPWKDAREREIFERRYGIGCVAETLEEVAKRFGITRERVRQIEAKAVPRLMRHPIWKELRPYLGDVIKAKLVSNNRAKPLIDQKEFMERVEVIDEAEELIEPEKMRAEARGIEAILGAGELFPISGLSSHKIIEVVARAYKVEAANLFSNDRHVVFAYPRQVAMYLMRKILRMSFPTIAETFSRDHTTVMHGCEKFARWRQTDKELDTLLTRLEEHLRKAEQQEGDTSTVEEKGGSP